MSAGLSTSDDRHRTSACDRGECEGPQGMETPPKGPGLGGSQAASSGIRRGSSRGPGRGRSSTAQEALGVGAPGTTSKSSFSMAWMYLTRIFVSSSTCWSVRLRRTRASRSVLPISNTMDGVLLGRAGPLLAGGRPNVQSSERARRRQIAPPTTTRRSHPGRSPCVHQVRVACSGRARAPALTPGRGPAPPPPPAPRVARRR